MDTSTLIRRLSDDAAPVALWQPGVRYALGISAACVAYVLGMAFFVYGLRPDVLTKLSTFSFHASEIWALITGALAAYVALRLSTPYTVHEKRLKTLTIACGAILMAFTLTPPALWHELGTTFTWSSLFSGVHCALDCAILALPPAILLFYAVKRGASTHPHWAAACATFSAAAFAYFGVRLVCVMDSGVHNIALHLIPMILIVTLAAVCGRLLLRW